MKRSIAPLLFGIVFLIAGLGYVGSIFFDWNFTIFFRGWWTMFIIIPSFISILANGPRSFNIGAFMVGSLLLLSAQRIIPNDKTGVIIVCAVVVYIGITLIIHFIRGPKRVNYNWSGNSSYNTNNSNTTYTQANANPDLGANGETNTQYENSSSNQGNQNTGSYKHSNRYGSTYSDTTEQPIYNAILSGVDAKNISTDFGGAKVSAILGGVDLDLRDVVINRDITIYVTAILGGVDIFAPQNVRIHLSKTDILGGTDCKAMTLPPDANVPLVTFVCNTIMGGIDIK